MAIIRGSNWLDEKFSRWESPVWELSRVGIFQVRVFLGGSCPGGSFPEWELSGWEFSWVGVVRVGIFLGGIVQVGLMLGGNFLCWKFSGWEFSGGNHPCGNFLGGSFHVTLKRTNIFS